MAEDKATTTTAVDPDRDIINSLLAKLGVEEPGKYATDRAKQKLVNRLQTKGVPAGMDAAEQEFVTGLGYDAAPKAKVDKPDKPKPAKPATGGKAAKAAPEGGKGANTAPKAAKPGKKRDGESGLGVFAEMLAKATKKNPVKKQDVIDAVIKRAGTSAGTAASYVVWAKRPAEGGRPGANPHGFMIEEFKDAEGNKVLRKL